MVLLGKSLFQRKKTSQFKDLCWVIGLFQKKKKLDRGGGGWGYGFSRDLEEIASGISRS